MDSRSQAIDLRPHGILKRAKCEIIRSVALEHVKKQQQQKSQKSGVCTMLGIQFESLACSVRKH